MAGVKCLLGLTILICISMCTVESRKKKGASPRDMCPTKRDWKQVTGRAGMELDLTSDDLQRACDTVDSALGQPGSRQDQHRAQDRLLTRLQEIGNLNLTATYRQHRHLPKCDVTALAPKALRKVHKCMGTQVVKMPRKLSKVPRQRALELILEIVQAAYSHTEYVYERDLGRSQETVYDSHVTRLGTARAELADLLATTSDYVSVTAARYRLSLSCTPEVPVSELFLSVSHLDKRHRDCQLYVFLYTTESLLEDIKTLVRAVDRSSQGKHGRAGKNKRQKSKKV